MNSASGINDGFNHIIFDSGQEIRFNSPPGEISGLIYGDRKLALIKKSYYMDEKNFLFCEVNWGKDKNGSNQLCKFNDYFSGMIVRLKPTANTNDYKKIKKKDIEEEIGLVYGRFTGKVYFQNQLLFDVSCDYPFQMINYEPCLQSDCRFRKDIVLRKLNDFLKAQEGKEELEEIQRRDRKLRK